MAVGLEWLTDSIRNMGGRADTHNHRKLLRVRQFCQRRQVCGFIKMGGIELLFYSL